MIHTVIELSAFILCWEIFIYLFTENGLNIENCKGNATNGAANMQGKYNGFF
jgi:hypothetical protein